MADDFTSVRRLLWLRYVSFHLRLFKVRACVAILEPVTTFSLFIDLIKLGLVSIFLSLLFLLRMVIRHAIIFKQSLEVLEKDGVLEIILAQHSH